MVWRLIMSWPPAVRGWVLMGVVPAALGLVMLLINGVITL